jgi:hypothetical protein
MSRRDKFAIFWSAGLLLTVLAAGGYGLSKAYHYNEPSTRQSDLRNN